MWYKLRSVKLWTFIGAVAVVVVAGLQGTVTPEVALTKLVELVIAYFAANVLSKYPVILQLLPQLFALLKSNNGQTTVNGLKKVK